MTLIKILVSIFLGFSHRPANYFKLRSNIISTDFSILGGIFLLSLSSNWSWQFLSLEARNLRLREKVIDETKNKSKGKYAYFSFIYYSERFVC